jgi:hypothetical protein
MKGCRIGVRDSSRIVKNSAQHVENIPMLLEKMSLKAPDEVGQA